MTESHLKALKILAENPAVSQRYIAKELKSSLDKANYIVKALVKKDYVRVKKIKNSSNRLSYMYILTPGGDRKAKELSGKFLKKKFKEYEMLRKEIRELKENIKNFGDGE